MAEELVITSGWHPALARLEMMALLPDSQVVHQRLIASSDASAARRSSLLTAILSPYRDEEAEQGRPDYADLAEDVTGWLGQPTRFVARGERLGPRIGDWHSREVEVEFGSIIHDLGHPVDLHQPEATVRIYGVDKETVEENPDPLGSSFTKPLHVVGIERSGAAEWKSRVAPNRPFFRPVSVDPRVARAMANLACPQGGRLLDPFCGTGGLLVEANHVGIEAFGSDLDPAMVAGSKANLEHAGFEGAMEVRKASATELPAAWGDLGAFDGFAFDPPYGRNAWKSDEGSTLLNASLAGCAAIAKPGARLVTLLPVSPDEIREEINENSPVYSQFLAAGWKIESSIYIRVHASLARLLLVCTRVT